ncbi:MAG: A/G-specific adenine glycosylase [Actinomycetia bacterium]|nr:A/G-specific adenine glycosylase [Actinomycetes bacterium]
MLQQTQVDRVIPKFEHFIDRWPTIEHLAQADTTEILEAWSGLGYNTRAIRLVAAAQIIAASGWPTTATDLQQLPGIGPYTSAAIASIAFGCNTPAIDTNIRRVLSRWTGVVLEGSALSEVASSLVGQPAGDWNQAIMDLGATICRPRNPACDDCPVEDWCTDPTIYLAPPRQGTFKGSNRELRGALVRAHIRGDDLWTTGRSLGRSDEEIAAALEMLTEEGLIVVLRTT